MAMRLPLVAVLLSLILAAASAELASAEPYRPPQTARNRFSFNGGWKFLRSDAPGAEQAGFDDGAWTDVSLPHTWNDVDTYRAFISHGKGDRSGAYRGIGWYRKHFRAPDGAKGGKVFLEFDGLRQAARFWVNGTPVGLYENGITPVGLDVTRAVNFGGADNVIAVYL